MCRETEQPFFLIPFSFKISTVCYVPLDKLGSISLDGFHQATLAPTQVQGLNAPDGCGQLSAGINVALHLRGGHVPSPYSPWPGHKDCKSCWGPQSLDSPTECLRSFWVPQVQRIPFHTPQNTAKLFYLFLSLFDAPSRMRISTAKHLMVLFFSPSDLPHFFLFFLAYAFFLCVTTWFPEKWKPSIYSTGQEEDTSPSL